MEPRVERLCIDSHGRTIVLESRGDGSPLVFVWEAAGGVTVCEGVSPARRYVSLLPARLRAPAARATAVRLQALHLLLEEADGEVGGDVDGSVCSGGAVATGRSPPRAAWAARLAEALMLAPPPAPLYTPPLPAQEAAAAAASTAPLRSWLPDSGDLAATWARNWACGADPCVPGAALTGRDWGRAAAASASAAAAASFDCSTGAICAAPPLSAKGPAPAHSPPRGGSPLAPPARAAGPEAALRWPLPGVLLWAPSWVALRVVEDEAWVFGARLLPPAGGGAGEELHTVAAVVGGGGGAGGGGGIKWVALPVCAGVGCGCGGGSGGGGGCEPRVARLRSGCEPRVARLRSLLRAAGWFSGAPGATPPPSDALRAATACTGVAPLRVLSHGGAPAILAAQCGIPEAVGALAAAHGEVPLLTVSLAAAAAVGPFSATSARAVPMGACGGALRRGAEAGAALLASEYLVGAAAEASASAAAAAAAAAGAWVERRDSLLCGITRGAAGRLTAVAAGASAPTTGLLPAALLRSRDASLACACGEEACGTCGDAGGIVFEAPAALSPPPPTQVVSGVNAFAAAKLAAARRLRACELALSRLPPAPRK